MAFERDVDDRVDVDADFERFVAWVAEQTPDADFVRLLAERLGEEQAAERAAERVGLIFYEDLLGEEEAKRLGVTSQEPLREYLADGLDVDVVLHVDIPRHWLAW